MSFDKGDKVKVISYHHTQKKGYYVTEGMLAVEGRGENTIEEITSGGNALIKFSDGHYPVAPEDLELVRSAEAEKLNPILTERDVNELSSFTFDEETGDGDKTQALRYNKGKLRWRNFPMFMMRPLAEVGQYGESKYDAFNFLKGSPVNDIMDCLKRHLDATEDPTQADLDPESKCHHLAHVAWNALFALWVLENKPELDDRFRPEAICPDSSSSKAIGDAHFKGVSDEK